MYHLEKVCKPFLSSLWMILKKINITPRGRTLKKKLFLVYMERKPCYLENVKSRKNDLAFVEKSDSEVQMHYLVLIKKY